MLRASSIVPRTMTATSGDTAPNIGALGGASGVLFIPAASAYTITNFVGGGTGQEIAILNTGTFAVTIDRSNAYTNGSVNQVLQPNYIARFIKGTGSFWHQAAPLSANG